MSIWYMELLKNDVHTCFIFILCSSFVAIGICILSHTIGSLLTLRWSWCFIVRYRVGILFTANCQHNWRHKSYLCTIMNTTNDCSNYKLLVIRTQLPFSVFKFYATENKLEPVKQDYGIKVKNSENIELCSYQNPWHCRAHHCQTAQIPAEPGRSRSRLLHTHQQVRRISCQVIRMLVGIGSLHDELLHRPYFSFPVPKADGPPLRHWYSCSLNTPTISTISVCTGIRKTVPQRDRCLALTQFVC